MKHVCSFSLNEMEGGLFHKQVKIWVLQAVPPSHKPALPLSGSGGCGDACPGLALQMSCPSLTLPVVLDGFSRLVILWWRISLWSGSGIFQENNICSSSHLGRHPCNDITAHACAELWLRTLCVTHFFITTLWNTHYYDIHFIDEETGLD